jgi:hypothetical protein
VIELMGSCMISLSNEPTECCSIALEYSGHGVDPVVILVRASFVGW